MKVKYRAAALLAALLLSFPEAAWAGDACAAEESGQKQELNLEKALQKAKKNSIDLRGIAGQAEYLQELKEDLWDTLGHFNVPDVDYQKWVDDYTYSLYSSAQSISSNMAKNNYSREITEISLEATVKNYFTSILSNEDTLRLARKTEEIQKMLYTQGKEKYSMGMISKYDLQELENNYKTAQDNIQSLEKTLAEEYRCFYQLLGEKEDAEYTLVYDVEYEPYTMNRTMEQYIADKLKNDYTILQKEQSVEDAEFNMNYLAESTTNTQNVTNKYNYDEAKRSLKSAKQDKELAIKNAYDAIRKLEDSYTSAEKTLETAQSKLTLAQLDYEIGRGTELAQKQAELAVEEAQNALRQIVYAHDLQVYQFENTELLSNASNSMGASGI